VVAGPNGAGKTTLLKFGVRPQKFNLFEELTPKEHIYYLTRLKRISKQRSLEITKKSLINLSWNRKKIE